MQVTKDQAEKSRYFGFRGWLLFFYISSGVFGTITSGMNVIFPSSSNNLDYFGGDETVSRVVHLIYVLTTIPFLILAPIKHRWAPKLWLFSIWTNWIVFAIALDMPARNSFAFILIVLGLVSVLLMTWYILASKRINATYRHKIRPDKEAVSDAPGVKGENGQILKARQPRRWVLYAVGVPLSIVATLFLGAAFWGLYETNKHRFGDRLGATIGQTGMIFYCDSFSYGARVTVPV